MVMIDERLREEKILSFYDSWLWTIIMHDDEKH